MKKRVLLGIISIALIGGVIGYLMVMRNNSATSPVTVMQVQSSPSPAADPFTEPFVPPSSDTNTLLSGGSSYSDPQGSYSLLYPNDYKLDTQDPLHTRIYKIGATQKGQTEMYDGVLLVFEKIDLQGSTLEKWVDTRIQESTADGTQQIVEPKKAISVNGQPGFVYATRGLGEATNYIVKKNTQSQTAIMITTSVQDPEKVNYQSEVDAILSTVKLQK